jgi:transcriptional regulator with XRE-family HTH domain
MDDTKTAADRRLLGWALRAIRTRAGITQKEMSLREGLDETYVSRVEHGRIDVKWSTLLRFLRVLSADLKQLADEISEIERRDTGSDALPPPATGLSTTDWFV